jgi:hypothetical protein
MAMLNNQMVYLNVHNFLNDLVRCAMVKSWIMYPYSGVILLIDTLIRIPQWWRDDHMTSIRFNLPDGTHDNSKHNNYITISQSYALQGGALSEL